MSLADLKKKKTNKTRRPLSVDDFIEDATAYSQGRSTLDSSENVLSPKTTTLPHVKFKRFKNATFSLSQTSIVQLNQLAQATGVNKSKLIRILVATADPKVLKVFAAKSDKATE